MEINAGIIAIIQGVGGLMGPLDLKATPLLIFSGQIMDPNLGPGQLLPAVDLGGQILPFLNQ